MSYILEQFPSDLWNIIRSFVEIGDIRNLSISNKKLNLTYSPYLASVKEIFEKLKDIQLHYYSEQDKYSALNINKNHFSSSIAIYAKFNALDSFEIKLIDPLLYEKKLFNYRSKYSIADCTLSIKVTIGDVIQTIETGIEKNLAPIQQITVEFLKSFKDNTTQSQKIRHAEKLANKFFSKNKN